MTEKDNRMLVSLVRSRALMSLVMLATGAGCAAGSVEDTQPTEDVGYQAQNVAACQGDDQKYDYNAFAASLAIAVANELGRWEVATDFEVRNGKLELSNTGTMRCNGACPNTSALLRLQDDSASVVPNHSPSVYRGKLTTWYGQQVTALTNLVSNMLYVDKGIYRLKAKHSSKYMAVDGGSTADNAVIEQRATVSQAGADQWRLVLDGTTHRFINVRSGKCLALATDSYIDGVAMVQQTCSSSTAQRFDFAQVDSSSYAIRTKYLKALDVQSASQADDAPLLQWTWNGSAANQQWAFESYGSGSHIAPIAVATAVYTLTANNSGQTLGVDNASLADGALVEQGTYNASDDRFHWYVMRNGTSYALVNRHSGKCMGLLTDNGTSRIAQQTCNSSVSGQAFWFNPTGDGRQVIFTKYGKLFEVEGNSSAEGAYITQAATFGWDHNRQFTLTPILAGEPHRLSYAYKTNDATCGEYNFWYNIKKPNGEALDFPQDTWVQLMFAGGKQTATGSDQNPFIAQQVTGNLVAIDPTVGLNEGGTTSSGSCTAACTLYSSTSVTGSCCACNGVIKSFVRSPFSASMYLCTGA